jgi:hypothetical protein
MGAGLGTAHFAERLAAAMARTRHNVSGATTSQHRGTAFATMAGWKLKKAALTGPAVTRPRGAARAAK